MKKIAIVGLGHMGKIHLKEFEKADGARIFYAADTNPEARPDGGIKDNVNFYTDYRKMIDGNEIDGIIVATPTNTHKDICSYALSKGIDVLVEKPCGDELAVPLKLKELEKMYSKKVHVGCQCRFMAPAKKMRELMDEYAVIPESIEAKWTKLHRRSHGGAHYDEAFHSLDLIQFLSESYLKSVYASLTNEVVDLPNIGPKELIASANFSIKYVVPVINRLLYAYVYAGMHEAQETRQISIKGIASDKSYIKITGWFSDTHKVMINDSEVKSDLLTGLTTQCVQLLKAHKEKDGFTESHVFAYPGRLSRDSESIKLRNELLAEIHNKCEVQGIKSTLAIQKEETDHLADELKEWVGTLNGNKPKKLATLDEIIKVHKVISMGIKSNRKGQVVYVD